MKIKESSRNDRIAYAQSWNLAVPLAIKTACYLESDIKKELKKEIEKWQKYFYNKLTSRE